MTTYTTIILALLAISEVLALVPAIASNSIFQLIVSILKRIAPGFTALFSRKKKEDKSDKKTK